MRTIKAYASFKMPYGREILGDVRQSAKDKQAVARRRGYSQSDLPALLATFGRVLGQQRFDRAFEFLV